MILNCCPGRSACMRISNVAAIWKHLNPINPILIFDLMAHHTDTSQYHHYYSQYYQQPQQQQQHQYQTSLPLISHQQQQQNQYNFSRLIHQQQHQQQHQHQQEMNYPFLSSITQHIPTIMPNNIHITQFPLFDVNDCLTINNLQTALVINNRANDGIFFSTNYQQQSYAHK